MLEDDNRSGLLDSEVWNHEGKQPSEGIRSYLEVVEGPLRFEPWAALSPATFTYQSPDCLEETWKYARNVHFAGVAEAAQSLLCPASEDSNPPISVNESC